MVCDNQVLEATLIRIEHFWKQIEKLRQVGANPRNYELSFSGFLAEIDWVNFGVWHYFIRSMFMYMPKSKQYAA